MDGRLNLNCLVLKSLRRNIGLSQEAMARECFNNGLILSLATLKRAESGKAVLYRTANSLAKYYNVPLLELVSTDGNASALNTAQQKIHNS